MRCSTSVGSIGATCERKRHLRKTRNEYVNCLPDPPKHMPINKLVDAGEVYVIGEYHPGTNTPTGRYKIGMTQNDRSTYDRIIEHQTGNPNRLFIHGIVWCEASYLVEKMMHNQWNANRIGQEWFTLTPAELVQVMADIAAFEAQHSPNITAIRQYYYATPNPGDHPGLTAAQMTRAQTLRDDAYDVCRDMAELKFEYEALKYDLLVMSGVNAVVDSVTKIKINPPTTEFSPSLLPAPVKAQYTTLTQKPKDDFRFVFTQTAAEVCNISLASPHWKNSFSTLDTALQTVKANWTNTVQPTITIATANTNSQPRTPLHETLHEAYVDKLREYEEKKTQKEIIELELRILCANYEGIANVCRWRRVTPNPKFNKPEFKILEPAMYVDPAYQAPKGNTAIPSVIKFKAW